MRHRHDLRVVLRVLVVRLDVLEEYLPDCLPVVVYELVVVQLVVDEPEEARVHQPQEAALQDREDGEDLLRHHVVLRYADEHEVSRVLGVNENVLYKVGRGQQSEHVHHVGELLSEGVRQPAIVLQVCLQLIAHADDLGRQVCDQVLEAILQVHVGEDELPLAAGLLEGRWNADELERDVLMHSLFFRVGAVVYGPLCYLQEDIR